MVAEQKSDQWSEIRGSSTEDTGSLIVALRDRTAPQIPRRQGQTTPDPEQPKGKIVPSSGVVQVAKQPPGPGRPAEKYPQVPEADPGAKQPPPGPRNAQIS